MYNAVHIIHCGLSSNLHPFVYGAACIQLGQLKSGLLKALQTQQWQEICIYFFDAATTTMEKDSNVLYLTLFGSIL